MESPKFRGREPGSRPAGPGPARPGRRRLLTGLVAAPLASATTGFAADAATWPSKTIRIVVPFPPGGIVDTVTRQLQPRLQETLGQTVIADNRSGANGTIGATEVARAQPDGHTLLTTFDSYATYRLTYPKLAFDPARDLVPITQIAHNPLILVVHPSLPASDLKALVTLLRQQPGRYTYASVGAGSSNHLTAELFQSVTETRIVHVPYRGGGPAQQDLIGGQVDLMFLSAVLALPHVQSGRLRALAQTGAQRASAYADVPTVAESGWPGFAVDSWVGMLAPRGTPIPVIERLNREIRRLLDEPSLVARFREQGLTGIGSTPGEFATLIAREQDRWTRLVRERNLNLE